MEDIKCDDTVVQLTFHPTENLLAGAKLDGHISLWKFEDWKLVNERELDHHKSSCRAVKFSTRGNQLFSISKDRSLQTYDLQAEKVSNVIPGAHKCAPYCLEVIDSCTLATGDDDGRVKVWDLRQGKAVMDFKEMEEFVSSLTTSKDSCMLIATNGEGTLTVFNYRGMRKVMQSELFESEFLCATFVKGGKKFVVGCEDGVINIFNNKQWGNISDRFPCHRQSIDCLSCVNDNLICVGSADGNIRAVNILPNKVVGIVGEHEDSVENMALSNDSNVLVSCGQDNLIKFWNVEYLHKVEVKQKKREKKSKKQQPHLKSSRKQDFFNDLNDESD